MSDEAAAAEATEATAAEETTSESTETTTSETATEEAGEAETLGDAIAAADDGDGSGKSDESKGSEETTANEDGESGSDADGQPEGAPEEYAAFDAPEGFAWSEDAEKHWAAKMKEGDVSQADAQFLLEVVAEQSEKFGVPDLQKKQDAAYAELRSEWLKQAKKDPLLGGEDGELWDSNVALVKRTLDTANEELKAEGLDYNAKDAVLEMGGLNHPALMHVIRVLGRRTLPDTLDPATGGGGSSKSWDDTPLHEKLGYGKDGLAADERVMEVIE